MVWKKNKKTQPYSIFTYTNQSQLVPDAQSSCIAIQWIYNIADGWLSTEGF